jgi:hypothetical protein
MGTSGTGHDRCPSLVPNPSRRRGRHLMAATEKIKKPVLVSRGGPKFFWTERFCLLDGRLTRSLACYGLGSEPIADRCTARSMIFDLRLASGTPGRSYPPCRVSEPTTGIAIFEELEVLRPFQSDPLAFSPLRPSGIKPPVARMEPFLILVVVPLIPES